MLSACLTAEQRSSMNKSSLKQLRKSGRLPGVVMGLNKESTMVHLSMPDFKRWMRNTGSGMLELQIKDSETIPVLLEGVQRDAVTGDYIHVDLLRVKTDEPVVTKIALNYIGIPKGTKMGAILQTQSSFIEVKALPHQLVSFINVDISEMDIGDTLLAGDIQLPPGVAMISSENELLLSIVTPKLQAVEAEEESAVK